VQRLLTDNGISTLSTWFLTGQGSQTIPFLNSTIMFFTQLSEAVAAFTTARATLMKCDNMMVWGQPCSHLVLDPFNAKENRKLTVEEKLTPLFTADIRVKWATWLGGLHKFQLDPWEYQGPRHTWDSGLKWFEDLGLQGLGTGSLTAMQLANTAAILGIIQPPTDVSMAHWIRKHPLKGAFRGLNILGFDLDNRPGEIVESYVLEAFRAVYHHLDQSLSPDDKVTFGFDRGLGVIFVEHLLCKVVKWAGRFPKRKEVNLFQIGQDAQNALDKPWVRGANSGDQTGKKYPIPLKLDENYLESMEARLRQVLSEYTNVS
jgi:hypothetical protein